MTCECVTHWIWYLMPGSSSSPDHPVTTHLQNICHIITGTSTTASWPRVLLPKSQPRWFELFHLLYQEFWLLKTFKSGQGSLIFRHFAAKFGFNPGSDGFWIGETINFVEANLIGDVRKQEAVLCMSWCQLHPSWSLSHSFHRFYYRFVLNVGQFI